MALAVFTRLAEAEAAVHGATIDTIHFREVGAVDPLADIVEPWPGFASLDISRIVCCAPAAQHGWVACAHGEFPCPDRRCLACW